MSEINYKDPDSAQSEVHYEDNSGLEIKDKWAGNIIYTVLKKDSSPSYGPGDVRISTEAGSAVVIPLHVLEKIVVWAFNRELGNKIKG